MSTTIAETLPSLQQATATLQLSGGKEEVEHTKKKVNTASPEDYRYKRFLPTFDTETKYPPLTPFEHKDPGLEALMHDNPREFLGGATAINALSPNFGSEIEGVQLHKLDAKGKSQLALYVAQRGVVVFRDQDFIDQSPDWQLNEWGKTFGRLHIHPTSGAPAEYPEFYLVYKDGAPTKKGVFDGYNPNKLSNTGWHSDVTYEQGLHAGPGGGGVGQVNFFCICFPLNNGSQSCSEPLSMIHESIDDL